MDGGKVHDEMHDKLGQMVTEETAGRRGKWKADGWTDRLVSGSVMNVGWRLARWTGGQMRRRRDEGGARWTGEG